MNRTLEIITGTTGEIQIDAVRFKRPDCEKATAFLEEALGVVRKKVKKPEYHQILRKWNQQRVWAQRMTTAKPHTTINNKSKNNSNNYTMPNTNNAKSSKSPSSAITSSPSDNMKSKIIKIGRASCRERV